MAKISITEYYAMPGNSEQLATLLTDQWTLLREADLVTDRPSILMRDMGGDDRFIEVVEWKEDDAPDRARVNPDVADLSEQIRSLCENEVVPEYYEPVRSLQPGGN